ncbi:MAG: hypothetical protein ABIM89_16605 [Mycobacteriales bacterium]
MIDDDVITRLVDLHDHIKPPETPFGADAFRGCRRGSAGSPRRDDRR